jgi:tRNA-specific 2-thiouridylase
MSGGVDSSVAAARLVAQGYEVVGVTLHLWDYPEDGSVKSRCCAPEDIHDARRVADALGIAHYAFDRRELFEREIVTPFVEAYLEGTTPSPCVRCNRGVKMKELFALADRLGAERVATGHYARIEREGSVPRLLRGKDRSKDQSYFLHMLGVAWLNRLIFPLGNATKAEVRAEAERLGLPGAGKGESQELCFVPTGRYDGFVTERAKDRVRPGPIVDREGRVVGKHRGIHQFTLGQRKNLGVALGERVYVVRIDPETATVELGSRDESARRRAVLAECVLASGMALPLRAGVAVRYRGEPHPAEVRVGDDGRIEVRFDAPVSPVVPGQYAVFYDGDRVLGGGLIRSTPKEAS